MKIGTLILCGEASVQKEDIVTMVKDYFEADVFVVINDESVLETQILKAQALQSNLVIDLEAFLVTAQRFPNCYYVLVLGDGGNNAYDLICDEIGKGNGYLAGTIITKYIAWCKEHEVPLVD